MDKGINRVVSGQSPRVSNRENILLWNSDIEILGIEPISNNVYFRGLNCRRFCRQLLFDVIAYRDHLICIQKNISFVFSVNRFCNKRWVHLIVVIDVGPRVSKIGNPMQMESFF